MVLRTSKAGWARWVGLAASAALGLVPLGDARAQDSHRGSHAAQRSAGRVQDADEGATPAMPLADLERRLAPLGDRDVATRRAAAKSASDLAPDAVAAIGLELEALRKPTAPSPHAAMHAARDRGNARDFDVVDALATSPSTDAASTRAALTYACLIRSLGHIGTTPAVRLLVLIAADANGDFRPELTKEVKQLGDRAVAALIEARLAPSQETKYWASNMLDMLNKRLPSDAVQSKNNQVLADVMHAYGVVRDLDAVPVILSFVNSDRAQVRTAAREALESYGQDAMWKLRESYIALTGHAAPEAWDAAQLATDLFASYDKFRLQEVYALLTDGLRAVAAGQLDEAVADFDKVLARQPMLDRRAEMAPAYVEYARSIEDKDRQGALAYLRKATRLDDSPVLSAQAKSEIAYLEGEELVARGIPDVDHFRRAVVLDPTNRRAEAELHRRTAEAERRQTILERWLAGGAAAAVFVAGMILFAGKRKRAPSGVKPRRSAGARA